MAKAVADTVLDQALNKVATGTRVSICSGQPANYAGIAAVLLASVVVAGGDFAVAAGSQRKVTMAAKSGVSITSSGTATHICIDDGATLFLVTTCTSQALTSGGTVSYPAWVYQIAAPT